MGAALSLPANPAEGFRIADVAVELIGTMDKLMALLSQETALVEAHKIEEIGPLQAEKTRLTRVYQTILHTLRELSNAGQKLDQGLMEQVFAIGRKLAEVVADNERSLRAAKVATDRLLESIVGALREQRAPTTVYSPRKMMSMDRSGGAGITLDRRL